VRYFRNSENLGFDLNLISAVEKADGEYVWLFSDDDWLADGALEGIIDIIKRYQPCFISTNYHYVSNNRVSDFRMHRKCMVLQDIDNCDVNEVLRHKSHFISFVTSNIIRKNNIDLEDCKSNVEFCSHWIQVYMAAQALERGECGYLSSFYAVLSRIGNDRVNSNVFLESMPNAFKHVFEQFTVEKQVQEKVLADMRKVFLTFRKWVKILIIKQSETVYALPVPVYYKLIRFIPRRMLIFSWKMFRLLEGKGFSLPDDVKQALYTGELGL